MPKKIAQQLRRQLSSWITGGTEGSPLGTTGPSSPNDNGHSNPKRGRLLLETLERRQMMAGDVELFATEPSVAAATSADVSTTSDGEAEPQGEPGLDLVALAQHLDASGFEMYGGDWCPACTQQKQLFEDGGDDLPFTHITLFDAQRTQDPQFASLGITQYPTWILPNNQRLVGVQTIETLMQLSNFSNPTDERPTFEPIGSQSVAIGSPLHIPVDGYDAEGGPLTVTVSVADPALLEATVLTGNRSLRLDLDGFDDMVFELFEQRAPRAAGRVADLAESGFYDGIIFHRVIDDFVIQGGDPTGTGTGGSTLGDFDDDFHPDLQHNTTGVLSFAKSSDDTNDSQFFVTEVPTRFLDFNHSVFGQIVEGDSVREAISETHTGTNDRPTNTVRINTASVFTDTENSVVMLKALAGTGTTSVTFTITDSDGNSFDEVVSVTITEDVDAQGFAINSQPYLGPVTAPSTVSGNSTNIQLTSIDVEGDPVTYFAQSNTANVTATVNASTGLVEVNAANGFSGVASIDVGVRASTSAGNNSDNQRVTLSFNQNGVAAPTAIDLRSSSDSGVSQNDNLTREGSLTFDITGVTSGATVEIINLDNNDSIIGVGTATGTTVTITTNNIAALGNGAYNLAARQTIGSETGPASPSIALQFDTTAPTLSLGDLPTIGNVGAAYTGDIVNTEEGNGVTYGLTNSPTGATISAGTGIITWTPTQAQLGANNFTVTLTDNAGNVRSENYTVQVAGEPLAGVRLEAVDLQGNVLTSVNVGDDFNLRLYGLDLRERNDRGGVFAAFTDIIFDGTLSRVRPGESIEYETSFGNLRTGTASSGLIDEIGAVSSFTSPTGLRESLIATIPMEALASGTVNFVADPADDPDSEVLLFFEGNQIPADAVNYQGTSLAIGQTFTAGADTFNLDENSGATVLDVLANDVVVSGSGTLSVVDVTQPTSGGSVTLSNGEVSFTPTTGFVGTAEFTYRVTDSGGVQENVPVTVTVNNVNDPPVGVNDAFTIIGGSAQQSLDVLANEASTAEAGETLTITGVTTPTAGGTVAIASDGLSVNYTPPSDFVGVETFQYTLSDGSATDDVIVTLTITSPDAPPTAANDAFPASGDAAINEDAAQASYDVLANDLRDTDNQVFSIDSLGTPSAGGSVAIGSNGGALLYTPLANFNGTETVTYTIRDTGGGLATATATFTVTAVNDAPPVTDSATTFVRGQGQTVVLNVADFASDNVDAGETLTFENVGTATNGGTVTRSTDGTTISYTPPSDDFSGTDTFTFGTQDNNGLTSGTATMTITVAEYQRRDVQVNFSLASSAALSGNLSALRIEGTNILGETVSVPLSDASVQSNADGFNVPDLLPGSYKLMIPAIPFLHNGEVAQEIDIESGVDEGDESVTVTLGRVRAQYLDIRDWFGSSPRRAILAAVTAGESAIYALPSAAATSDLANIEVDLNTGGTGVVVRASQTPADGGAAADVTGSASLSDAGVVRSRGQSGDMQLLLINLEDTGGIGLTESTVSAASSTPSAAAASSASLTDVFVPGEQEAAPSGEPISVETNTQGISATSSAPAAIGADSTDAAMPDVLEQIQRISQPGEEIAEAGSDSLQMFSDAVDQVLTDG